MHMYLKNYIPSSKSSARSAKISASSREKTRSAPGVLFKVAMARSLRKNQEVKIIDI
jgi:hypothetical protein